MTEETNLLGDIQRPTSHEFVLTRACSSRDDADGVAVCCCVLLVGSKKRCKFSLSESECNSYS